MLAFIARADPQEQPNRIAEARYGQPSLHGNEATIWQEGTVPGAALGPTSAVEMAHVIDSLDGLL